LNVFVEGAIRLAGRRADLVDKIALAARAVVPVLLDAQRVNSARELQELLFELDALDQELAEFTKAHMDELFRPPA
jgi:hypothetical protein